MPCSAGSDTNGINCINSSSNFEELHKKYLNFVNVHCKEENHKSCNSNSNSNFNNNKKNKNRKKTAQ